MLELLLSFSRLCSMNLASVFVIRRTKIHDLLRVYLRHKVDFPSKDSALTVPEERGREILESSGEVLLELGTIGGVLVSLVDIRQE
jgi:hypothetical protein